MERTIKMWTIFDRQRLRKIFILKSNKEVFLIRTKILLRDSLRVITTESYWSKESLEIVFGVLMAEKQIMRDSRNNKLTAYAFEIED